MAVPNIFVRPTGWETSPTTERFALSPIAHTMPKIYVLMAEVFPLAANAPSPDTIVKTMTAGLEFTMSQFPAIASTLQMDADSGRMWAAKKRDSGVHLHVKDMSDEDAFPSYAELEAKDFPAALLDGNKLLPTSVTAKQLHSPDGNNDTEGIPLAAFQINFIQGGLVLCLAIHHVLSDGPGCDGFLTTWAENTTAAARGEPFKEVDLTFDPQSPPLHIGTPSPARMAEIRDAYPVLKDAGGPMAAPPPGFQMPNLVPQMWHFPKTKLEVLKKNATGAPSTSPVGDGWVSTYDVVMALLWSRITAAKLPLLQPDIATTSTTLVHAVNTRRIWSDPALPDRFLESAAVQGRCGPLLISDVIATSDRLSGIASAVRSSIRQLTLPYLRGMLEWIAGHKDQRYLETNVSSFLGLDLGGSSWQGITAYEKHDFGFGLPRALRWPSPPFEGFVFLYPSRASFKPEEADEGIEVCICLEESCQSRLLADAIMKGQSISSRPPTPVTLSIAVIPTTFTRATLMNIALISMESPNPLSETESVGFFQSLLSQPRLLARTGPNSSPYRPMRRALMPIEDSATIARWTSSLRDSLIDQLSGGIPPLSWAAFLPLQIMSRPYHWSDEPSSSSDYLVICTKPGTTGWEQAARAARNCLAVLHEHGVTSMETLVTELELVVGAGPPSLDRPKPDSQPDSQLEPQAAPFPTDARPSPCRKTERANNAPEELQGVFDIRFSSLALTLDSSLLGAVNEALLPFLPLPGQNIQPMDDSDPDRDLPSGSITGFLRLEDSNGRLSNTVYALASRHVAVRDMYDYYTDFSCTSASSQQDSPDIRIHTGAAATVDRQLLQLRDLESDLADRILRLKKVLFKDVSGENQRGIAILELMEECHSHYIGKVREGLSALGLHGESCTSTRQVGHVAFAAGHGIDREGFWKDWALIALRPTIYPDQPGLFFTNKVYAGNWPERVKRRARQMQVAGWFPGSYTISTPDAIDDADFVNVQVPHPPMLPRSSTRTRPVVKRGPVTGLTVGLLSPIEAVVRRPLPGGDVVAWAWPVLSCVMEPDDALRSIRFSAPGDSGSLIFDTDGVAVGMLDAGLGVNEKPRRTFQHYRTAHGGPSTNAPTSPLQGNCLDLPDQSEVPQGFMSWDMALPEGGETNIDITLITPIDAVLASIEKVTGQTPRMV